ncbi:glycosyltransferase family protein [Pseudoalteromonas peptidolytica]|uniref:glycosyltransferase family protein n=1 Tax=Pseudoalteromonas peptidolytica TaxID=61150 RepID=UPI00298E9D44|nr:glycosyltransferase family protein [Pseudoalteromonas peptidolytica]MDW7550043.1 glycosyltransferase family protein [Pseudoalteromonas peptidolytica]
MSVYIFSQARFDSTRLPGKVLKAINGRSLLDYHIERVAQVKLAHQHVIVTSIEKNDDCIVTHLSDKDVIVRRGSKHNVLERFVQAAQSLALSESDYIVRLTGDCPLVDPTLIDALIQFHLESGTDYSNIDVNTIPRGFDAEIFNFKGLLQVFNDAKEAYQQEHVTPYFYQHPTLFQCASLSFSPPRSAHLRLCVDELEDFQLVERVITHFGNDIDFVSANEIIDFLNMTPDVASINACVGQKKLGE